jgi:predicted nucleotidyltransferase
VKQKEVCDKINQVLSREPEVLAIFNNGSSAVGLETPGSDVDFVVILKKEKDKERIIQLLRKTFNIFKNEENPEIDVEEQFNVSGKRADFAFIPKKRMEEKVNTLYDSKEKFLEFQHFVKHKIVDSVAIYDPGNILVEWKKKVEKYPKKIMEEVFNSQIVSIKENLFYWQNHRFRNEFQFGFEQWEVIQAICQAIYAKNKRLFMLPYKRLHKDLKELKPNIEKEMYTLIRGTNTPEMIKKKIKIVKRVISKLEK